MMAFGFADLFTSTLDLPTAWITVRVTGREMIKNLLHGKL
jgi:C-8 sterol isomerase